MTPARRSAVGLDGRVITGRGYRLEVSDHGPRAVLRDAAGRVWSDLSLLASVDRVGAQDESVTPGAPTVERISASEVIVELSCETPAWDGKTVRLRCRPDAVRLTVTVSGSGVLTGARLLGGSAMLGNGACGTFRSSIGYRSVFSPSPTEPVAFVRDARQPAVLGISGDASPGRLHAVFSPPPLCLVWGSGEPRGPLDIPDGDWLAVGVHAPASDLRFTEMRYAPVDDGFLIELDYDAHTEVAGEFTTPAVVLRPATSPWQALHDYRDDHPAGRRADAAGPARGAAPSWWSEPIFCGWGAQCARAAGEPAAAFARADVYDDFLAALAAHRVRPGTIVIDDKWQAEYGTAEPDPARWPALGAWIAERHAAGQRVLLWWKAWDPEGLPAEECVLDTRGRAVAVDPESRAYRARLRRIVAHLLGPGGLDADGFKVDFTQRAPVGHALRRPATSDGTWGIALLHRLLAELYQAATSAKPDALIVTHTPHPAFADVCDMVRLNDVLERDAGGAVVDQADQMRLRRAVVRAVLPHHLIDTDQWPMLDLGQWRGYLRAQAEDGVPALYYVDAIDRSGERLGSADLAAVARQWSWYRRRRSLPDPVADPR